MQSLTQPNELLATSRAFVSAVLFIRRAWVIFKTLPAEPDPLFDRPGSSHPITRLSPLFLQTVRDSLLNEVIAGAARLTDKRDSGGGEGKRNLSVAQIISQLPPDHGLRLQLEALVGIIPAEVEQIRNVRNAVLSHTRLRTALTATDPDAVEPDPHSIMRPEALEKIMNVLAMISNTLAMHFGFSADADESILVQTSGGCLTATSR